MTQLFTYHQEKLNSFMNGIDEDLNLEYQLSEAKSEKYGFDF